MQQSTQPEWWAWVNLASNIFTLLGIPTLVVHYRRLRKLMAGRKIKATPLEINSGFKGLICSVSAPFPPSPDPIRDAENIKSMVAESEHPTTVILATPIGSVLKAMNHHERYLTHCWLLASPDCGPYLKPLREAIQKYFPLVEHLATVNINDVYCKVDDIYDAVHQVFDSCQDAPGEIESKDIIADVTAGTKIMSVGIAMACLDRERNIQYIEQKERKNFYKIDITWEKITRRSSKAE